MYNSVIVLYYYIPVESIIVNNNNVGKIGGKEMPGYTINLTDEADSYVRFCMEKEHKNRSQATSYLVKMGYIYAYKHMKEAKEGEK